MGFDQREFRDAMGNFCTGVVVVTGIENGEPVGFTAQSFVSLSLDPPLVAICPGKASTTWPKIKEGGGFCINILSDTQAALSNTFAKSEQGKFSGVSWASGKTGSPVIAGILAYVDCTLEIEYEAGDHTIAIGRVADFGVTGQSVGAPLLFSRGGYGKFSTLAK